GSFILKIAHRGCTSGGIRRQLSLCRRVVPFRLTQESTAASLPVKLAANHERITPSLSRTAIADGGWPVAVAHAVRADVRLRDAVGHPRPLPAGAGISRPVGNNH